jgi:hypothetical protein
MPGSAGCHVNAGLVTPHSVANSVAKAVQFVVSAGGLRTTRGSRQSRLMGSQDFYLPKYRCLDGSRFHS